MNQAPSEESSSSHRRDFLLGRSAAKEVERFVGDKLDEAVQGLANFSLDHQRQTSYLEQYVKNAMACEFEINFNLHQYQQSSVAAMEAFELIDDLEQQMTVYRDDSEISLLNQNGFANSFKVERQLFELLCLGQKLSSQTQGAFDMTSGHLSRVWGFERRKGKLPDQEDLAVALRKVGYQGIELDECKSSVQLKIQGLKVNLGGIGKGYALDRVGVEFAKRGIHDFLLHGGQSSLLACGTSEVPEKQDDQSKENFEKVAPEKDAALTEPKAINDNEDNRDQQRSMSSEITATSEHAGWLVGVTHPNLPSVRLAELVLRDAALGTSGTAKQGFFHRGKRYGHIIDPRTGWPAGHFLSTTVIAPSAAVADALATAFFVMHEDEVAAYCSEHREVGAILISEVSKTTSEVKVSTLNIRDQDWRIL